MPAASHTSQIANGINPPHDESLEVTTAHLHSRSLLAPRFQPCASIEEENPAEVSLNSVTLSHNTSTTRIGGNGCGGVVLSDGRILISRPLPASSAGRATSDRHVGPAAVHTRSPCVRQDLNVPVESENEEAKEDATVMTSSVLVVDELAAGAAVPMATSGRTDSPHCGVLSPPPQLQSPLPSSSETTRLKSTVCILQVNKARREAFLSLLWCGLLPAYVASYLTVADLAALGSSCRAGRRATRMPYVWRRVCEVQFAVRTDSLETLAKLRRRLCTAVADVNVTACMPTQCSTWTASSVSASREGSPAAEAATFTNDTGERAEAEGEEREPKLLLRGLDSQVPTPCERGSSAAASTTHCSPTTCGACVPSTLGDCGVGEGGPVTDSSPATAVGRDCSSDAEAPDPLTAQSLLMPRIASSHPAITTTAVASFPWEGYTHFLHRHRVRHFLQLLRRTERTRVAAEGGVIEELHQRVEKLSYSIHVLMQREPPTAPGLCTPPDTAPELQAHLVASLVARGEALSALAEAIATTDTVTMTEEAVENGTLIELLRRRAFEDFAVAEALCPDDPTLTARVEAMLAENRLRTEEGTDDSGRKPSATLPASPQLSSWEESLCAFDMAASGPRGFAPLAVLRRVVHRLSSRSVHDAEGAKGEGAIQDNGEGSPARQLFLAHVMAYVYAREGLGLLLPHLLVRAAVLATGPQEQLLVRGLQGCARGDHKEAAAWLELALSLLPAEERTALAGAARSWTDRWILDPQATLQAMVQDGLTHGGPHLQVVTADNFCVATTRTLSSTRTTLLSIVYYVLFAANWGRQDAGSHHGLRGASSCQNVSACGEALIHFLTLSRCRMEQAASLTWLATLYLREDGGSAKRAERRTCGGDGLAASTPTVAEEMESSADGEGFLPMPEDTAGTAVALRLLHTASHLTPHYVPAHLFLSRLYAQQEEEQRGRLMRHDGWVTPPPPPSTLPLVTGPRCSAFEVLSRCIHCYAVPFLPTTGTAMTGNDLSALSTVDANTCTAEGETYLRRRERSPFTCFIPAALLAERSRVERGGCWARAAVSDLAENALADSRDVGHSGDRRHDRPHPISGCAGLSLRRLADIEEAATHDPRHSYAHQVKAAVALDAAMAAESARESSASGIARSLAVVAERELTGIVALTLRGTDVTLYLRFLVDRLATTHASPQREARLLAQIRYQTGLLSVLKAGEGPYMAERGLAYSSVPLLLERLPCDTVEAVEDFLATLELRS